MVRGDISPWVMKGIGLQLDVLDDELRLLIAGHGHLPGWTDSEIRQVLLVAQCTIAAQTPSDLYALRILRLRPSGDDAAAVSSVLLSADRQLIITFKTDSIPMTAVFDARSLGTEDSR